MVGVVTRRMLPHLSGVPHLYVNRPLVTLRIQNLCPQSLLVLVLRPPGGSKDENGWQFATFCKEMYAKVARPG